MKPLVVVVGPTAVGKTQLAIKLAQKFNGEIVNADSRQVYRYMDVGTAKPTTLERKMVKHHLVDIIEPHEKFNIALYQKEAFKSIDDIQDRKRLPVLTGGSGLYIWAVVEAWKIPEVQPDFGLREKLKKQADDEGVQSLFEKLKKIDPEAASTIDHRNVRRVVRALEVINTTGRPFSGLKSKGEAQFKCKIIGLTLSREELIKKIDQRVENMIKQGLIEEVKSLLDRGYSFDLPPMSGIGYSEIEAYLRGKSDLNDTIERIKNRTHRFARRQYSWFRLKDNRISWIYAEDNAPDKAQTIVEEFLRT